MDLSGNILCIKSKNIDNYDINYILDTINSLIKTVILDNNRNILSVGISVPGWINPNTEIITFAPHLKWRNVDLKSLLLKYIDLPIYIDNEANVTANGEGWVGSAANTSNYIAINFRTGIGSGIVLNGNIYRGITGSSGEIGHITVDDDGKLCSCGNYGCLETIASRAVILEQFYKKLKKGMMSSLKDDFKGNIEDLTIENISKAAKNGDNLSIDILNSIGRNIGIALSIVLNLFNTEMVILGGDMVFYGDVMLPIIKDTIESKTLPEPAKNCKIVISSLGENAPVIGAGIYALQSHLAKIVL